MAGPVISITVEAFTGAAKSAVDAFFNGVQAASSKVSAVNAQWKEFGNSISAAAAAFAAYFGAAKLTGFVQEAAQAREAMARLNNEIRKSGQPVQDFTADLQAHRQALQQLTGTDDDVIVSVQTMLLTMGVQRSEMRQNTLDVLNLAAALGIDAVTAAKQLGNALAGDSFSLRGMKIDIDTTLPKAKQLEQALTQLRQKIAGQAEAKFLGGAPEVQRLTVAMGELRKEIGGIVIDSGVIETLRGVVDWMRSLSTETKAAVVWMSALATAILGLGAVAPIIARIASAMGALVNALAGGQLVLLLGQVKSLADLKAFFTFPEVAAFASVAAGVGLIVAAIWTGVEAWRAYDAAQDQATSEAGLATNTVRLIQSVREQIDAAAASGRITVEQAREYRQQIYDTERALVDHTADWVDLSRVVTQVAGYMRAVNQEAAKVALPKTNAREITQAELDAQIAAGKAGREADRALQAAILDDRRKQRKISDEEYFRQRESAIRREYEVETAVNAETLRKLAEQRAAVDTNPDLDFEKRNKAQSDLEVKRIQLQSEGATFERQTTIRLIELSEQRRAAELVRVQESLSGRTREFEVGEKLRAQALQMVENDWRATDDEKLQRRISLTQQDVSAYDVEIARLSDLRETQAGTFEERLAYQERINDLSSKRQSVAGDLARLKDMPDPNAFGDQLTLRLVQLRQQWGSMARNMATILTDTVTNAVNGLSNALTSVIMGTQSAGAAFRQFAVNMLTSFISSVISMILMAQVAIPILTALGVLSGGSIPSAGAPSTIAAVLGAQAAVRGSYADGGIITTGTGPRSDDVLIRASRGEYVMPANRTADYFPLLEAMRRGLIDMRDYADAIPRGLSRPIARGGAYADGGMVAGGVAGDVNVMPAPVNVAVLNSQQALRDFMANHGSAMAFNYVRKHKAQLGLRS